MSRRGRPSRCSRSWWPFLRGRDVGPVARLRTRRETVRASGAEIVDDFVSVFEGRRVVLRFRELEVELVGGDERVLRRLEKVLRSAGAVPRELQPKLFRALGLAAPEPIPTPRRGAPAAEALGHALAAQARAMLVHDPGIRLGTDPEELHRFRVATRRLRAFLRVARPILDRSWSEPLRAELRWLGGALGPARDLDVLEDRLTADRRFARRGSGCRRRARRRARQGAGGGTTGGGRSALERSLPRAPRSSRARGCAGDRRRGGLTREAVAGGVAADAQGHGRAHEALVGRGAARGADSRQARPLRGRAGVARAREGREASRRGGA